jgi:hypothetical protein
MCWELRVLPLNILKKFLFERFFGCSGSDCLWAAQHCGEIAPIEPMESRCTEYWDFG